MIEVGLHLLQRAFLDLHVRFRLMQRRHYLVEIRLGGVLLRDERLSAGRIQLRQVQGGAGIRELSFRLIHVRLEDHGINLRDHVPRFHNRIKVGEKLLDVPRDLAAHLDVLHRIQRSRRGHGLRDRAAGHGHRLKILSGAAPALAKGEPDKKERDNGGNDWERSFKHFWMPENDGRA
jgi:hypothetical protein